MHRSEPKATRGVRVPPREIHRLPVGGHLDLAALVPALGLVPGVDPFVLLDGEGWDLRVLAFEPEHTLTIRDASPFEKLRGASIRRRVGQYSSVTSLMMRPAT